MSEPANNSNNADEYLVSARAGLVDRLIAFCLHNKIVVFLLVLSVVGAGYYVMPFERRIKGLPSNPIPVDAIPDTGENQQIVFAEWPGRSPQDVEDQVTYPLAVMLQGVPGVKSIRSQSMFGFSSVAVIFKDNVDFYWCRARIVERLSGAAQQLPQGVVPSLGPDATALGQIFWYTLEGRGWGLDELRSIQDWYVRYALQATDGVSEVASVGGYVREYQVDVDPDAMRAHGVTLQEVFDAVQKSNVDVGADTIEFNGVEYVVRGKGYIRTVSDVEETLVKTTDGVPIYVGNVADVHLGPAVRRGALDKEGAEVVGGVVVVRHGENPLAVINRVKDKIAEISVGLPRKTLADGTVSQVTIVPFYDRTDLIRATLGTLNDALIEEILITCFVVFILLAHFRSNLMIVANLPLAVLVAFILMKLFHVDSNLMSLGGIAIAIGTMVDMGIILSENIVRHFSIARPDERVIDVVYRASSEVGGAVMTAVATTIVSFLPVFTLTGQEGKLFKPLAYTKTFALFGSVFIALTVLPAFAHILFARRRVHISVRTIAYGALVVLGVVALVWISPWAGLPLIVGGAYLVGEPWLPARLVKWSPYIVSGIAAIFILALLTIHWMPLGIGTGLAANLIFVFGVNIVYASSQLVVVNWYRDILAVFLRYKALFMILPLAIVVLGLLSWRGWNGVMGWAPGVLEHLGVSRKTTVQSRPWQNMMAVFPGLGREFMPSLDEGSFLYMPTTMPHASIGEALDIVRKQDMAIRAIPEVESVVGKVGRADTALDPAPVSMIETIITYKPEYGPPDPETGKRPRLWGDGIHSSDDIWDEITKAADVPGSTGAPKLQPIAGRVVMLQSGMRAPMGLKVYGTNLKAIEKAGYDIARFLEEVPSVKADTVVPDRVMGKPYLEINIDREKTARYKVNIRDVQDVVEIAIGGMRATTTVEGRERYAVRVRYERELRDTADAIKRILVPSSEGMQIPLDQLATLEYVAGPQAVKSEDTFLVSYVTFDKNPDYAEVDTVEAADRYLKSKIADGELTLPPGTHYAFAGNYQNQVNFQKRFMVVMPVCLLLIFLILYFQFRSTPITFLIFVQIAVVGAGGFIAIWLAGQHWFLDFSVFGRNLRDVFHLRQYNLSVAVWVGFIALFGIATDDAVVITTYLNQLFAARRVRSRDDIRSLVVEGGAKRVRPCLMTTATTALALLPVLTSSGRGADVVIPMALPIVGGVSIVLVTLFITPVVYSWFKEFLWKHGWTTGHFITD